MSKSRDLGDGFRWVPAAAVRLDTGGRLPGRILGVIVHEHAPGKPPAAIEDRGGRAVLRLAASVTAMERRAAGLLADLQLELDQAAAR
jgi:hypothetical protein